MIFLGSLPPGYGEYMIIMIAAIITVIVLVAVGLNYLKKSRIIKKDSFRNFLYAGGCIFIIITLILVYMLPNMLGGSGFGSHSGYLNATNALLWILGIIVTVFILFVYLIHSKKKIVDEAEEKKKGRYMDLTWLKHQYYNLGRSIQDIADDQHESMMTIKKWIDKLEDGSKDLGAKK